MSWFRVEDDFADHPKTTSLTDGQFRTWVRVLGYASRIRTDGLLETKNLRKTVPKTSKKFIETCLEIGLFDAVENAPNLVQVHDWSKYQPKDPTAAERARRYRDKHAVPDRDLEPDDRDANRDGDRDEAVTPVTENVTAASHARAEPPTSYLGEQDRGLSSETVPVPPPSELDQPPATQPPGPPPENRDGDGTRVDLSGIENLQPLTGSVRDQLDQLAKENAP